MNQRLDILITQLPQNGLVDPELHSATSGFFSFKSWRYFSTRIVTWITGLKMSGFIIWLNDFLCCLFCKNNDVPLSAMSLSTINNQYKSTNWYSDSWITFVRLVSMNLSPGCLLILLNWKMFLTGFRIIPCRHLCSLKPK